MQGFDNNNKNYFKNIFWEFLLGISSCFQTTFQVGVFSVTWKTTVTIRGGGFLIHL